MKQRLELYNAKIQRIKDLALDNYESHLNRYIYSDLIEALYDSEYYLIDHLNYYYYWLDLALDLDAILKEMYNEDDDIFDQLHDVFIDAIEVKKVIDANLIRYKTNELSLNDKVDQEIKKDISSDLKSYFDNKSLPIQLAGSLSDQEATISSLYNYLTPEWIPFSVDLEDFKKHFLKCDEVGPRIIWRKRIVDLLGFIELLFQKKIIVNNINTSKDKCKLIFAHFNNKDNKIFNLDSLIKSYPNSKEDMSKKLRTFFSEL